MTTLMTILTKCSIIPHVFTGGAFLKSAKNDFKILSRHFKGEFVTAVTAKTVLNLGAYAFSIAMGVAGWWLIDERFNCESFEGSQWNLVSMLLVLISSILYMAPCYRHLCRRDCQHVHFENQKNQLDFDIDDDDAMFGYLLHESMNLR